MATVKPRDMSVLIRGTTTTTYHFGLVEPICGDARGHTSSSTLTLVEALAAKRRLCRNCADLVTEWCGSILSIASSTDIVHPDR